MEDLAISMSESPTNFELPSNLAGVDLRGEDLSCVDGITAEQLRGAILDQTTMMPPGLEHLVREVPNWSFSV